MRHSSFIALAIFAATSASAQQRPVQSLESLTVEEAIQTALANNPAYRRIQNTLRSSDAQVRSAYGALLPTSNASFGASFNQGGSNIVQGVEIKGADLYSTNFNFGLGYFINGAALYAPKALRANREATIANITGSAETLRGQVTQSYLTALQSQAQAVLQDSLVLTTQVQLDLASA